MSALLTLRLVVKSHRYSNTKCTHAHDMHVCLANDRSITCDLHYKSMYNVCESNARHTVWKASFHKWWRCALKQSMQLVHAPLSSWHNAVLGMQLGKMCYYSITHSSASSQGSHVSPALDRIPALPLQVWLRGLDQDSPPTSSSWPPQSTLLLLGGV